MNFYNIKDHSEIVSFKGATLQGLGKEKGLFVPERLPRLSEDFFKNIEEKTDLEIAITALYPFVEGSLTKEKLSEILGEVFSFKTPVVPILKNTSILELKFN